MSSTTQALAIPPTKNTSKRKILENIHENSSLGKIMIRSI
jgi:hypothetical protein